MRLTIAMRFAAGCLRWTARAGVLLAVWFGASMAIDHHELSAYVETHSCIVRARIAEQRPVYFHVALWTPASTAYECAAVDNLLWVFDPQPMAESGAKKGKRKKQDPEYRPEPGQE